MEIGRKREQSCRSKVANGGIGHVPRISDLLFKKLVGRLRWCFSCVDFPPCDFLSIHLTKMLFVRFNNKLRPFSPVEFFSLSAKVADLGYSFWNIGTAENREQEYGNFCLTNSSQFTTYSERFDEGENICLTCRWVEMPCSRVPPMLPGWVLPLQ